MFWRAVVLDRRSFPQTAGEDTRPPRHTHLKNALKQSAFAHNTSGSSRSRPNAWATNPIRQSATAHNISSSSRSRPNSWATLPHQESSWNKICDDRLARFGEPRCLPHRHPRETANRTGRFRPRLFGPLPTHSGYDPAPCVCQRAVISLTQSLYTSSRHSSSIKSHESLLLTIYHAHTCL